MDSTTDNHKAIVAANIVCYAHASSIGTYLNKFLHCIATSNPASSTDHICSELGFSVGERSLIATLKFKIKEHFGQWTRVCP